MQIRKTEYADLPRVMEIYAQARQFMVENRNPNQWAARNWPPESLIRQDIASGRSYVCLDAESIAGVFFFDMGKDIEPTYARIDGAWLGNEDYGVVHRIASVKKGAGSFCIGWALAQCRHLRMDTHADNIPMQNLLQKLGFSRCGIIYVNEDSDPRIAFEKLPSPVTVTVDRPLGSRHPNHPDIFYPVNYGFVPGILAADGEEQDAYILGVSCPVKEFTGCHIATIHRKNDVEDKWVIAPEGITFTKAQIAAATHFQEQYFDTEIEIL